ncbi:hypothetical protein CTAYLR_006825 [Chrysophaeum taylorii]|uniref:Uncharacterized protein n=1 Tax=Chrysophaeum taylorii TaxID=2483200 RepID=A0AAD7XKK8_9STRA|nr:hypothetical protein CTAYLR_006825 [Chrysophaeum taylorii]
MVGAGRWWREGVAIATVVCLGGLNSIFSKIRADQLQEFDGLACGVMNAIGYVVFYFAYVAYAYRTGAITPEMMRFMYVDAGDETARKSSWRIWRGAHRYIVAGGLADEAGQVCGFVAQPYVSIIASALLSQTSSAWNMCWSASLLGARYVAQEFAGVGIALAGASLEVLDIESGNDRGTRFDMALLLLASAAAPSLSFVLKEKCFRLWEGAPRPLLGDRKDLDVWVVASAAAVWSLAWAPAVTLATAVIQRPHNMSVSRYFVETARCFGNDVDYASKFIDDDDDDGDARRACRQAWQYWLLYMVNNICYNISIYRVVRLTSALTAFVCLKIVVPVAVVLAVAVEWPYVGRGTMTATQGISLVVILVGVAIFRHGSYVNERRFGGRRRREGRDDENGGSDWVCCWPLADYILGSARKPLTPPPLPPPPAAGVHPQPRLHFMDIARQTSSTTSPANRSSAARLLDSDTPAHDDDDDDDDDELREQPVVS